MEEKVEGWTGHRGLRVVAGPRFRPLKLLGQTLFAVLVIACFLIITAQVEIGRSGFLPDMDYSIGSNL